MAMDKVFAEYFGVASTTFVGGIGSVTPDYSHVRGLETKRSIRQHRWTVHKQSYSVRVNPSVPFRIGIKEI